MGIKKNSLNLGTRVGLLGGGQLARMLALKGSELGLEMHVLSPLATDPAAQVTRHWHQGSPDRLEDLVGFFKSVDLVTVESEFHDAQKLKQAEDASGTSLFPSAENLAELQDRLPQKERMQKSGLPTAEFISVSSLADLERAFQIFKGRFVLKKRRGGYDGYGTFIVKSEKDLKIIQTKLDFTQSPCIAEAFIPFRRELAVVAARNSQGDVTLLPLVETHQVDSRLDWLRGPMRSSKAPELYRGIKKFLKNLDYVGTIAFELFETKGSQLLVNEIAPRVHNSAHYSLEALEKDQFRLHLLAILGSALESQATVAAFAMVNLIGNGASEPKLPAKLSGHLHWYGKNESRKGRKMGHVTYVGTKASALLQKALRERKGFKL